MKNLLGLLLLLFTTESFSQVIYSGSWIEKSYEVEGKWKIVKKGERHILIVDEDFDTKKAPDLKIFLSKLPYDKVNEDNAPTGAVKVAALKKYEGKQEFAMPKGINLADYKTLLIHCEEYGVLWSVAKLN
jgi:hypothetical protein